MALRDEEPFATFRAEPRRFAVGLPLVFLGGALVGALLLPTSFELALAVQIVLQTVGFVWLYVPALRRRRREAGPPNDPERSPR
jgi:hypothetical protein